MADIKLNQSQIPSDLSDEASSDAEEKNLIGQAARPRSRTNVNLESETSKTRSSKTAVNKKRDKVFKEPIKAPRTRRPRPQPGRRLDFGDQSGRELNKVTLKIDLSGKSMVDMNEDDKTNWLLCGYLSIFNVHMTMKGNTVQ